ncbi:MAG TPA: flagellar biosynthetic protein FliO [Desulfomicrobiaceae bacterium]|nr:flagellar biosynthetic protein FliO [Desulfomicrobiaceae bacterium]
MKYLLPLLGAVLLTVPGPALAGDADTGLQFSPVLRMLGGLGLVLGLILGGYGLLRSRIGSLPVRRKRAMRVVESCPLGPRKSVCLVRVRDREFLLGVTQQQISLLGETSPEEDPRDKDRESFGEAFAAAAGEDVP